MSDKHKLDPASRGGGGRTPQPPARPGGSSSKPNTQPRSRASTPTGAGEITAVSPSPTVSAVAGAKSNGAARQPKTISINNNNSSPRTFNSTRKPKRDEPASDDDGDAASRFVEPPNDEWLRQSELTLATMEKQVHDAAKRTLKHQTRCATMKASIAGKEERMDTLSGTYTTLTRALDELEVVSNGDIDSDALEAMFNSIPPDARAAALGPIDHLYSS